MRFPGVAGQSGPHPFHYADGAIASATNPQLMLAASVSRSVLMISNLSAAPMYWDIGVARATATITNGVVTGVTVTNGGFGFTYPPTVVFLGGGIADGTGALANNQPGGATPQNQAQGLANLSGGSVVSVTINNPGAKYTVAPYVLFVNDARDPFGCVSASQTSGFLLPAGGPPLILNGVGLSTDPISVFCPLVGANYAIRWMD